MVASITDATDATRNLDCAIVTLETGLSKSLGQSFLQFNKLPRVTKVRQHASLSDQSFDLSQIHKGILKNESERTFLYLAYGSNLCAATFQGKRQIKPLSQLNVVVPAISLTFDLPGIPYTEPCFGNCAYRAQEDADSNKIQSKDYHKDRWHKGLVGVVYEVTAADYAHIIATEGGGSGYKDVLVDCYELAEDPSVEVPLMPKTVAFKAHTLFSPPSRSRKDHSYAQPSARYKKLITDGADEHNLPYDYREYLSNLRTYRITTVRQRMGQALFSMVWLPLVMLMFGVGKLLVRKGGIYPHWFARLLTGIFAAAWTSYDAVFRPIFGDGERTIGDTTGVNQEMHSEKRPLLQHGVEERLDKHESSNSIV